MKFYFLRVDFAALISPYPYTPNLCRGLFLTLILFWLPAPLLAQIDKPLLTEIHLDTLQRQRFPLNLSEVSIQTRSERTYFAYYDLQVDSALHYFGYLFTDTDTLATHVFKPKDPLGTVFILHGYSDHSGLAKHLIHNQVVQGFAVVIFDWPGHGLSSGRRSWIDDFQSYTQVLTHMLNYTTPHLPLPHHLVCHSTGCAVAYDHLATTGTSPFDKVVFLAPLVRSAHWGLSKTGHFLASPFVKTIPRRKTRDSADPIFQAFSRHDPLQIRHVALEWVEALYAWNERIQSYPVLSHPILVIQGEDDAILDWRYNIAFLKQKIDSVTVTLIPDGKHQLFNDRASVRTTVLQRVNDYLMPK
jgi:alpha-beta hydrolase superfamily lysophospholipase